MGPQGRRAGPAASPAPSSCVLTAAQPLRTPASQDPSLKKPEALQLVEWLNSQEVFSFIKEGNARRQQTLYQMPKQNKRSCE